MKVCILGNGLSSLTLAKALVNQNIYVELITQKKNLKIGQSRTLGISKSNIDLRISSDYLKSNEEFDFVITLCDNAKDICTTFVNAKIFCHKHFLDPANAKGSNKEKQVIYDNVRNELREYFFDFSKKEFI